MIEKIIIKDIATFDNLGEEIAELKRINFIYGANGSGKTTISNFLQDNRDKGFENCSMKWKNDFSLSVLVYNKKFREQNFGKGKLSGIFTLGQATKEEKEIIDNKIIELAKIKLDGQQKRETLNTQEQKKVGLENDFKETSWTKIYKRYENSFKEAFVGSLTKERFRDKLLQEFSNNNSTLFTIEELKEKAKTIFGEIPQNITRINTINFANILEIANDLAWKKNIIGKADVEIAKLIQKLNINDWVNQGKSYIQEDNICPFCQQETITKNFRSQLESYFDETYLNDINSLKSLKESYNSLTQNLVNELNEIEVNQKNFKNTKLDVDKLSAYLKTLISQNATNNELLISKLKEPSRQIDLISLKEQLELIDNLIISANIEIKKHNDIVADFNNQKNILMKSVWKFIIEEFRNDIIKFNTDKQGLETGIKTLKQQFENKINDSNNLDVEIKDLTKNVTSIQPTIDEINRLLKFYGFLNFTIVKAPEDGYYQILRDDGTIAENTLSEGEITFITFLYYLQLAKGGVSKETVTENRILVIDDPISSLDSNVLFVVSTLIKEILKDVKNDIGNIKQVILLTHNIYFHKEVSFEGLNQKGEKSVFWILRKNNKKSTLTAYKEQNPIQSSYELLWREIKESENNSGITIQNTMRRILEHFFSILGNKRDDFLISKFETQEEKEICRSLLSWINEGSHTLPDDLYLEEPIETINKYKIVFENIFKHTENKGHFNMMMKIDNNNK